MDLRPASAHSTTSTTADGVRTRPASGRPATDRALHKDKPADDDATTLPASQPTSPSLRQRKGLPPRPASGFRLSRPDEERELLALRRDDVDHDGDDDAAAEAESPRFRLTSSSPSAAEAWSQLPCRRCGAIVSSSSRCSATGEMHDAQSTAVQRFHFSRPSSAAQATEDIRRWSMRACVNLATLLQPQADAERNHVIATEDTTRGSLQLQHTEGKIMSLRAQRSREAAERQKELYAQLAASQASEAHRLRELMQGLSAGADLITAETAARSASAVMDGLCRRCGRSFRSSLTCSATGELHSHQLARLAPGGLRPASAVIRPTSRQEARGFLKSIDRDIGRHAYDTLSPARGR
jgi:ribosomal protein L37E